VLGADVFEGEAALADGVAEVELDAAGLQQAVTAQDDLLLQLEAGDAVDHQAANAVIAVVDVHLVAAGAEHFGGGQTTRAGADDADGVGALVPGG
jgi:hypothetical protein